MAETSYPIAGGAGVTEFSYELLMANTMGIGVVETAADTTSNNGASVALVYADSTGRQVKVAASWSYLLRGYKWDSGTDVNVLALNPNTSGKTRIDMVVLRLDRSTWTVRLAVLPGTAADTPVAPTPSTSLLSTGVYEAAIAQVTVKSQTGTGLPSIASGDVKIMYKYLMPRGVAGVSTIRPAANALGRFYHEWDTGRLYLGSPGGDILIGENGPYTKIAASGGWTTDNIFAQRVNGLTYFQCYIRLAVADRPASTDLTVCILPAEFRPTHNFYAPVVMTPGQCGFAFFEAATGAVKITYYPQVFPTGGILAISPGPWASTGVKS